MTRYRKVAVFLVCVVGVLALTALAVRTRRFWYKHAARMAQQLRARSSRWVEPPNLDATAPSPTEEEQKRGFMVVENSILERVNATSIPRRGEASPAIRLRATHAEFAAAQIAVYALRDLASVEVSASDLVSEQGDLLPSSEISVRMVRYYATHLSVRAANVLGVVPKTLEVAVPIDVVKGSTRPYWITVHVADDQRAGTYHGVISLREKGRDAATIDVDVDVIPVTLDEPDILFGTLSLNVLSPLPWARHGRDRDILRVADIIFRDQREHGMNTVGLWSTKIYRSRGGHPELRDLDAAMELYKRYHFPKPLIYAPGALFKTNKNNRSAPYTEYQRDQHVPMARDVGAYYTRRFAEEGLPGIIFVPVEEPSLRTGISFWDASDIRQTIARDLTAALKGAGAQTGLVCTPQSLPAAIDSTDWWIVAYHKFSPDLYELAARKRAHLAIYANGTMMGNGTYFTRFLFGYFAWASGIEGMLPWTYPMTPKRFPVNLGGRGEGGLNVHDGFLGLDGKPIPTIQWELAREGIDDAKYLVTIERLAAAVRVDGGADAIALADTVDDFLRGIRAAIDKDVRHYTFEDPLTFEPQAQDGWDAQRFETTRKRSADLLSAMVAEHSARQAAAPSN